MVDNAKKNAALIVAAGQGTRAGGPVAKQWQGLAGRRVADWTVDAFVHHPNIHQVVVVLAADSMDMAATLPAAITTVAGGPTRAASVANGLTALTDFAPDIVLIHDVARPCVHPDHIDACIHAAQTTGAAALGVPMTDSVWDTQDGTIRQTLDRSRLWRAQTPQAFDFRQILAAHAVATGAETDDVQVALSAGLAIQPVVGSQENLKITVPADFARAEAILRGRLGH